MKAKCVCGCFCSQCSFWHSSMWRSIFPIFRYTVRRRGHQPKGTEIVGTYYDGVKTSGVQLIHGTFSTISFPAAVGQTNWTNAAGVNDVNTVVGSDYPQTLAPVSPEYGLTYSAAHAYASFVAPGPKMTWFTAINNQGSVVGYYQDWGCDGPLCNRRGLLLSEGSFSALQFPAAINTTLAGINNLGEVVGSYEDAVGWHGFTWSQRCVSGIHQGQRRHSHRYQRFPGRCRRTQQRCFPAQP